MKNKLILLSLSVLLLNCKKENDNPQPVAVFPNYSNLAIGNYWIYEIYKKDSLGALTPTGAIDSSYVSKDTSIRGNKYYIINAEQIISKTIPDLPESCVYERQIWRDSLEYIVSSDGRKLFTEAENIELNSGTEIFYNGDTLFTWITKTIETDSISVPFGKLFARNAQTIYDMRIANSNFQKLRYLNLRFAKDIGLAEKTLCFYANTNQDYVWRLKRFGKK